jgi:N,N-dimethylformamidase beta subunit-like, C-terminal
MLGPMADDRDKTIVGYCEPLSLRAGERIALHSSSHVPGPAALDVVRLVCGDPTRSGPGFEERPVDTAIEAEVELVEQPLTTGSWGEIDLGGLRPGEHVVVGAHLLATRPHLAQTAWAVLDGHGHVVVAVGVDGGRLVVTAAGGASAVRARPIEPGRWYRVEATISIAGSDVTASIMATTSRSPARDLLEPDRVAATTVALPAGWDGAIGRLLLGRDPSGSHFDGRLGGLSLDVDGEIRRWDLSQAMDTRAIVEVGGLGPDGTLHQLPARAVTGPRWDGSVQAWTVDPSHYDAVHFHADDLYDAGWEPTASLELPPDLPSGIYAFRVRAPHGEDRVPFVVRPARGAPTAAVALLVPTCTYLAYANHRQLIDGTDFIAARRRLRPEHEYVRAHPEVGRSHYEEHADRSGVMFSSRRRPVLNLRPGADGWNFTPDTDLDAFLTHTSSGHDVIADEDVHVDGVAALEPYRVVVTGTHPEYWSTAMLDALTAWQQRGGRLMYLGGNGLYWRVAFSEHWPGAMELRRAEDGVRNWQTGPGESYHAFGGEYGGLWRRLGRAPNELVGVGFAAQGFERATHYRVADGARESRAAWILDGVDGDLIGTSGLGGGAAGQEIDRYDVTLGSPRHAVVLASATEFGPDMLRTKEEFGGSIAFPTPDPFVRADMVFFESPGGGAVFSVGSISWFGALARDGYDNDVARITTNVLRRFADPRPFAVPPPA